MSGSHFDQTVVQKLRRDYRHDEAVAFLSQRLTESEVENGKLKSEIAELQDQVKELLKHKQNGFKDLRNEEYAVHLRKQYTELNKRHKAAMKDLNYWRDKAILLQETLPGGPGSRT